MSPHHHALKLNGLLRALNHPQSNLARAAAFATEAETPAAVAAHAPAERAEKAEKIQVRAISIR